MKNLRASLGGEAGGALDTHSTCSSTAGGGGGGGGGRKSLASSTGHLAQSSASRGGQSGGQSGGHSVQSRGSVTNSVRSRQHRFAFPRLNITRFFYRQPGSKTPSMRASARRQRSSTGGSGGSVTGGGGDVRHVGGSLSAATAAAAGDSTEHGIVPPSLYVPPSQRGPPVPAGQCLECPVCLQLLSDEHFSLVTTCDHRTCNTCLQQYLQVEIMESRVHVTCPECDEPLSPADIKYCLGDDLLWSKYEEFTLRRVLVCDPDTRWCPAPDCGYAVIAAGCASCPRLQCERPGCGISFCYHCKAEWHPNQTCDAARAQRSPNPSHHVLHHHGGSFVTLVSSGAGDGQGAAVAGVDIKPCPRCRMSIMKMNDGSCNHMTCAVCGAEFCWLCMKEISDLHYLSPSGCTFWGKAPWSRKKKIMWQLGMLVGAPVGVALVAGVAVPAMTIGIPVWVGRKMHARLKRANRHRRRALITGAVSASVVVSPVLAGLSVAIGVPILLAYIYGVVPISLCRSGGCGVTTTNSGGVRIEFDEDGTEGGVEDGGGTSPSPSIAASHGTTTGFFADGQSVGGHPALTCPSIGEVSSLSAQRDTDSASTRAIAGASLQGSLYGSAIVPTSHRLEVQGSKRLSLSSESAAGVSLGDRSATVSFTERDDNASTRALAGSIRSRADLVSGSSGRGQAGAGEVGCHRGTSVRSAGTGTMEVTVDVEQHVGGGQRGAADTKSVKSLDTGISHPHGTVPRVRVVGDVTDRRPCLTRLPVHIVEVHSEAF